MMAEARKQDEQDEQDQDASRDLPDNPGVGDEVDIGADIDSEDLMSLSMSTTLTCSFRNGTIHFSSIVFACLLASVAPNLDPLVTLKSVNQHQGVIERDPAFLCLYGLSLAEPLRSPRRTP